MHVPAVAFGFLFFIAAALAGLAVLAWAGPSGIGLAWALVVFASVLVAWVAVAVLRSHNRSQVEQP